MTTDATIILIERLQFEIKIDVRDVVEGPLV
jgi:hypothetical protein